MMGITEYQGETRLRMVFIEGVLVWSSNESEYDTPISVADCCATHNGEHRYALLGINNLEETIEDGEIVTLTDGTLAGYTGDGLYVTEDWVWFYFDSALLKKTITDNRTRTLYHNGVPIKSNKRYDGLFCCGDYALCTYVDDDYLSGWRNEWEVQLGFGDRAWGVDRKWSPNPGWGDWTPPTPKDFTADGMKLWDYYKAVYPGFKMDVFCAGEFVGTFDVSDANSPIHYDHLGIGSVWLIFAAAYTASRNDIGAMPWALEGTPKCHQNKLLIPFDGGITTCMNKISRRIFS
jgi:hypothetical protein